MVAADVPAVTPQFSGASANASSSAAATTANASETAKASANPKDTSASDGNADFNATLAQLLGANTAAEPAVAQPQKPTDTKKSSDNANSDGAVDPALLAQLLQADPSVTNVATNDPPAVAKTAKDGSTTDSPDQAIAANAVNAIVANPQLQTTVATDAQPAQADSAKAKSAIAATAISATDIASQLTQVLSTKSGDVPLAIVGGSKDDTKESKKDAPRDNVSNGVGATNVSTTQNEVPRTELRLQQHVGTPAWRDEMGAKLTWMVTHGVQQGTLRLSPESLGPMEVKITTQNDQVSVWFGAAHADTRAALEQAMPRLRELFAAQGMALSDSGVFREPPRDTPRSYSSNRNSVSGVENVEATAIVGRRDGVVDAYA